MAVQILTNNYILSLKIVSCILAASFTVSLFLLSLKWSGNQKAALVPACFTLFSPHLTYFAAQYPKNLLGVVLFLWLLYTIDSKIKFLPLILLVVNFFGHRVTAVLSFLSLVVYYIFRKLPRSAVFIMILFLLFFLVGGFLLPGILNLFDAERLHGIFASHPQFAPFSFIRTFSTDLISTYWLIEIIIACIVFAGGVVYIGVQIARKQVDHRMITLSATLLLLIFPFFQWSIEGPSFRFLLIFILLCPVLTIFYIRRLGNSYVICTLCVLPFSIGILSYKSYRPEKHDPSYGVYNAVAKEITSKINPANCELIIAHKSLAEYIVYSTKIDAMSWLPEYDLAPEKLWRVAAEVKDIQFSFYLSAEDLTFIYRLTPSYCFIREDVWQKFLKNIKKDHDAELLDELTSWKNPDKVRPYFMLKNKK
jgi:hypothetical protein